MGDLVAPVIPKIRNWLTNNGIVGDDQKQAVDGLKGKFFDDLKPSNIHSDYYQLLAALKKKLEK